MEFGLLGLLEVTRDGERLALGRGKESALLAVLLLHANEPLTADRLCGELWGAGAPANAVKSVQIYVSRLRKHLGADRLLTTPGGYVVQVRPGELDSDRFDELAADGRAALEAGDPRSADRLLSGALALWRGPPLADFRYDEFSQEWSRRLENERRGAVADRIDARLALGHTGAVWAEIRELIEQDPHWERPRGQLMLALYRSGRQAEALEEFRSTRDLLRRELGLEPGRELQELERAILNLDPALGGPGRPRLVPGRRRARAALYAVVTCTLVAGAAVAALELADGAEQAAPGNQVAFIGTGGGSHVSYTVVGTSPSNITAADDGVWVLNGDDRTITRIDPASGKGVKTFAVSSAPSDLAAGDGAVWVGTAATQRGVVESFASTVDVARLDPSSTAVTSTARLFNTSYADLQTALAETLGVSGIAVGSGAVWAIDPDGSISRIDRRTGKLVARVGATGATTIAAGAAGVWFVTSAHGSPAVAQVDPRTNTVGQVIPLQTSSLVALAVGAGSVWATDPLDGLVWRIDAGSKPLTRTISLGLGATQLAFGAGAVWAANIANDTVSRIDPNTDEVTASWQLAGTPRGLAVGGGRVWISVAGGTGEDALPTRDCGAVESATPNPQLLIASDLPLQGPSVAATFTAAVRFVLRAHGFRAGKYTVGYQSCDDSSAQTQNSDFFKCASNARDFGSTKKLVAVLGPYDSGCAKIEIPMLNEAPSGPVALVSPSTTEPDLTRLDPAAAAGEPAILYPTGVRNFFRVSSPDDVEGAAQAVLARQLHVRRAYILSDGGEYGNDLGRGFRAAARKLGLDVAGSATWNPAARRFPALLAKIARSHASGVVIAGYATEGVGLLRALRSRFGSHLVLIAGDGFVPVRYVRHGAGSDANGVYVSLSGLLTSSLTPAGRRLLAAFAASRSDGAVPSGTYLPEMLEAAEVVVAAIARSDGTRASVIRELHGASVRDGLFGGFSFDADGDITPAPFAIVRITGGRGSAGLVMDLRGSVFVRDVRVPLGLVAAG